MVSTVRWSCIGRASHDYHVLFGVPNVSPTQNLSSIGSDLSAAIVNRRHSHKFNDSLEPIRCVLLGSTHALRQLQVKRDAFSINEYGPRVDELLAGAFIRFVTAKGA